MSDLPEDVKAKIDELSLDCQDRKEERLASWYEREKIEPLRLEVERLTKESADIRKMLCGELTDDGIAKWEWCCGDIKEWLKSRAESAEHSLALVVALARDLIWNRYYFYVNGFFEERLIEKRHAEALRVVKGGTT